MSQYLTSRSRQIFDSLEKAFALVEGLQLKTFLVWELSGDGQKIQCFTRHPSKKYVQYTSPPPCKRRTSRPTLFFCDATQTYHKRQQNAENAGNNSGKNWKVWFCLDNKPIRVIAQGRAKVRQPRQFKQPRIIRKKGLAWQQLGFQTYNDYLSSELWFGIRSRRLDLDKQVCQCCFRRASQAHHLDYTMPTMRGDSIEGLRSICRVCHQAIEFTHGNHRRPRKFVTKAFYALRQYNSERLRDTHRQVAGSEVK